MSETNTPANPLLSPTLNPTREAVILDALRLVAMKQVVAAHWVFMSTVDVAAVTPCSVCALGSLFYARFRGEEDPGYRWESLLELFTFAELRMIEIAFEGNRGGALTSPENCDRHDPLDASTRQDVLAWRNALNENTTTGEGRGPDHLLKQILCNMLVNGAQFNMKDTTFYDVDAVLRTYGFNSHGSPLPEVVSP